MRAWLIYTRQDALANKSYIDWFIKEANKQHINMMLLYRDELHLGIQAQQPTLERNGQIEIPPDFAVIRSIEPMLQMHMESLHIPTFNHSNVATICNDKGQTYLEMSKLGIPVMTTYFFSGKALPTLPPLSYPFILKDAKGRGGKGVYMIRNLKEWREKTIKVDSNELIAQATDKIQLGKDVRVFVIGKEIIAAVLRKNKQDFRANFKLGGEATPYTLTTDMKKMIYKIINHFDFGLVGIDFLVTEDGALIFNEIEDVVGSRILSATSDINLLEKYITFIKEKLKRNEQQD